MTSRKTDTFRKIIPLVFLSVLGILILLSAFQKQRWDSDIFWALKSGEWIFANISVPMADPFSYTFGGKPWVDFTWGFQALAYGFYTLMGQWTGLFILQVILVSSTFLFIYLYLRQITSNRAWITVGLMFTVFAAAHTRFFIRPHLFEFFFVSLYFLLFTLYEKKGKPGYLYALVPIQVLWVNLHSSAVLGLFIAGAYAAGEVIDGLNEKKKLNFGLNGKIKHLLIVSMLLPAASLLNPYGLKLVIFPFIHNGIDNLDALKHIGEWTRPALNELFFYIAPFPLNNFAFVLLIFGTGASLFLNRKSIKARDILLLAAGLYLALSHVRWLALFAYFAAPVIASNLGRCLGPNNRDLKAADWCAAVLTVFFAVALSFDYLNPAGIFAKHRGLGLSHGAFPNGTVEFMKRERLKGNIYNDYVFGGYLIHEYPEVKVFIDGRTPTVYSPHFFWTSRLVNDPLAWKRLEDEYKIDMVLIKHDTPFCDALKDSGSWSAVSFDDISVLFLKRTAAFSDVISRTGMKELNACSTDAKFKLPDDTASLKKIRDDLNGFIAREGDGNASRPHRLLGLVDTRLGGEYLPEAVDELEKALAIIPSAEAEYDLGLALGKLKRYDEAIEAFKRAIELDKGFKEAHLALGLAWYDKGEFGKAIERLRQYANIADDSAEPSGYKSLGMSFFKTGDFEAASIYLKRAAFIIEDKKELGDISYNVGNSLFETGDLDEGALWYAKAIQAEPEYRKVLSSLAKTHAGAGRSDWAEEILAIPALNP